MSRFSFFDLFSIKIHFTSPQPQRLLNEALWKNVSIWDIENGEECVSFRILPHRKKCFFPFRSKLNAEETWNETPCGMLRLLFLFRKRIGFFIGFFFLVCSLAISTQFLWGIDVHGNNKTPVDLIWKQLAEYGISPGKRLSGIDAKRLAVLFDAEHDEYDYVGINVVGTRAKVEIRESGYVKEETFSYEGASNQVARIYGKVIRSEVLSGKSEVKKGDYVREGDLLISGIRENKNGAFYPVRAAGRVYAETNRSFSVTVFPEEVVQLRDREKFSCKSYEIFGFSFPDLFSFFGEKEGDEVLEFAETVQLFGYDLPIVMRERIFLDSVEKKAMIKVDRAEKLAYDKYEQFKRDTFAISDEILSENVTVTADENGAVTLTAELSAVENICREAPFGFTVYPDKN